MLNILIIFCVIILTLLLLMTLLEKRALMDKTPLEREHYRLSTLLLRKHQKKMYLSPQYKRKLFRGSILSTIPNNQYLKIKKLEHDINTIEHNMINIQERIENGEINI